MILGEIPGADPRREYVLVVTSEVLYYLDTPALAATFAGSGGSRAGRPAGRCSLAAARSGATPVGRMRSTPGSSRSRGCALVADRSTQDYLLHVLER